MSRRQERTRKETEASLEAPGSIQKKKLEWVAAMKGLTLADEDIGVEAIQPRTPASELLRGVILRQDGDPRDPIIRGDYDRTDPARWTDQDPNDPPHGRDRAAESD